MCLVVPAQKGGTSSRGHIQYPVEWPSLGCGFPWDKLRLLGAYLCRLFQNIPNTEILMCLQLYSSGCFWLSPTKAASCIIMAASLGRGSSIRSGLRAVKMHLPSVLPEGGGSSRVQCLSQNCSRSAFYLLSSPYTCTVSLSSQSPWKRKWRLLNMKDRIVSLWKQQSNYTACVPGIRKVLDSFCLTLLTCMVGHCGKDEAICFGRVIRQQQKYSLWSLQHSEQMLYFE